MSSFQRKDHFYHKAKKQGLPSRASFKIEEILKKFPLTRRGDMVLDLGAAPGGWTIPLLKAVGPQGTVLAIDPLSLKIGQYPNLKYLQDRLESPTGQAFLLEQLSQHRLQAIFSDMSPNLSGTFFRDAYASYELCLHALEAAKQYLNSEGNLVTKIFPGEEFHDYLKELRNLFTKVKVIEPQATRKTSREVYVVAMNFK